MSYYGGPYDFYPAHARYGATDGYGHDMQSHHPHDQHMHGINDMPHPDDAWWGPPPSPMYPTGAPSPHYSPYEPMSPYDTQLLPDVQRPHHPSSNLGNSFAIPKGTRNAMHRVAHASSNVETGTTGKPSQQSLQLPRGASVKLAAQSVGATTTATGPANGIKTLGKGAAAGLRPIKVKFEGVSRPPASAPVTTGTTAAPASPSTATVSLAPPPAWKRMFEAARSRAQGESSVAAPVVELASQVLNKRCLQHSEGGSRRFVMNVDSTILRRGVLSSRSNEGMTVALYLFQPTKGNGGELVTTDAMLCRMRISVDDNRLLSPK
ncbi:hypothetical protein HKX48_000281 [Thoreauomyces humboldtii]|nr:hypothetical protein HKX48_000281 [Thoreauomyces humboldtii]